jgi:SNF2 family DNA or RNA helicase
MNVSIYNIDTKNITLMFEGSVMKQDVIMLKSLLHSSLKNDDCDHLQYFQANIGKQVQYIWTRSRMDPISYTLCLEFGVPDPIVSLLLSEKPINEHICHTKIPKTFTGDLHPYQKEAFQFANEKPRTMLALDMGLGKTVIGVTYALTYLPALIVCPANVIDSWMTHIDVFAPSVSCTSKYLDGSHDITIISYHRLHHITKKTKNLMRCIIADEAHYLKHESSARSVIFAQLQRTIPRTLLLTGTPAQRHMDMYHLLKLMDVNRFPSFFLDDRTNRSDKTIFQFAKRYCVPKPVWLAGKKHGFKFGINRNVEELRLVCKEYLLRMTKEDVLTLPTMYRNVEIVDTLVGDAKKRVQLQLIEIETLRETKGSLYADAELLAMCRQTALDKVPLVCPMLNNIYHSNTDTGRCIIFFHHKDVGQAYAQWMNAQHIPFMFIDGSVSMSKRTIILNEWTKDDCKVQFGLFSLCATSTGLNLQFCTRILCAELTFHSCHHKQAESRIHRIGQTKEVYITYLLLKGSTDDMLWRCLNKKFRTEQSLFDIVEQPQKKSKYCTTPMYNIVPL